MMELPFAIMLRTLSGIKIVLLLLMNLPSLILMKMLMYGGSQLIKIIDMRNYIITPKYQKWIHHIPR